MEYPVYAESGWTGTKAIWIKNPDNATDAYHVERRGNAFEMHNKDDTIVRRGGSEGPVVGRLKFDNWKAFAAIVFENPDQNIAQPATENTSETPAGAASETTPENGTRVEMRNKSLGSPANVVTIPAAPEGSNPFTWKPTRALQSENVKCEDAKGTEYASFKKSYGLGKKLGKLKIEKSEEMEQEFLDQIVVSWVGLQERFRRQVNGGSLAGGAVTPGSGMIT